MKLVRDKAISYHLIRRLRVDLSFDNREKLNWESWDVIYDLFFNFVEDLSQIIATYLLNTFISSIFPIGKSYINITFERSTEPNEKKN